MPPKKSDVKCYEKMSSSGTPYTTCKNAKTGEQLRKKKPAAKKPAAKKPAAKKAAAKKPAAKKPAAKKPAAKKELPDDVLKIVKEYSKPSFYHYAEKAYKEIGEARKNVKFGRQVYFKSGQKKGKPRFFEMTKKDMEDQEIWLKEIEKKMAKKYSLPEDWDIKYRTNGGGEESELIMERNIIANELSIWV